jgi:hypothetical protein
MPNDDDISKLLRLKRFEQPPEDYYEDFLKEFRDRQRSEMLREPVWRIAWDRLCALFGEQLPARMGYGLASSAVLVAAAIACFNILESRPVDVAANSPQVQHQQPAAQNSSIDLTVRPQEPDAQSLAQTASFSMPRYIAQPVQIPDLPSLAHTVSFSTPRYVLDAQPVSYVQSSPSF